MLDPKDKKNTDLKFFYNNTLFKDIVDHKKHTELKKLFTVVDKSLNGSTISVSSSQRENTITKRKKSSIILDRHKLVNFLI
jgi:hypothetical protein